MLSYDKWLPFKQYNLWNNILIFQAPVFLFFLDCVWQLMNQYPVEFEVSATFLTVLYDGSRMTAFDTFIFNNEKHRHKQREQKRIDDKVMR